MRIEKLYDWPPTIAEAKERQRQLALRVSRNSELGIPRFIAGVDMSVRKAAGMAIGAVVVLNYPELEVVEMKLAQEKLPLYPRPFILPGVADCPQRL